MSEEQTSLTKNGPPPAYNEPPPAYPGPQQVYVSGQSTVILRQMFHEDPVQINCVNCKADVITSTHYENGTITYLASGLMCIVGLWLGCCLIPFCLKSAKDVVHTCPSCGSVIGRYTRM